MRSRRASSVRVAVIDTTIDAKHPGSRRRGRGVVRCDRCVPTSRIAHGTGIASVIAAHGKLTGAAPGGAHSRRARLQRRTPRTASSLNILKGLDWAGTSKANIVNMSFAGPPTRSCRRMLTALRAQGRRADRGRRQCRPEVARRSIPPPIRNVIAVTATDMDDKLFAQANRGTHIAVAAPGVRILAAAPDERLSDAVRHLVRGRAGERRRGAAARAQSASSMPLRSAAS